MTRRAAAAAEAPPKEGPIILDGQVLHSIEPHRLDVINSMEKDGWVDRELSKMLKPVEQSWQPADYLPDPASDTFMDEVCLSCVASMLAACHMKRSSVAPPSRLTTCTHMMHAPHSSMKGSTLSACLRPRAARSEHSHATRAPADC